MKENKENLLPADQPQRMAKSCSLNIKQMIKEGILEYQEGRTKERAKIGVNPIDFSSPFEFYRLCLIFEAKIMTLPYMILNVYKGNI